MTAIRPGPSMQIREDDLHGPEVVNLIRTHLAASALHSPPESVHALDIEALRAPGVTFWTIWQGAALTGCGGLKELDEEHGEIKSMHTAEAFRGQGVGRRMLTHIVDQAKRRGYGRLSLETGSMEAFAAARALYAGFGFSNCAPFADYKLDPYSVFMTLDLRMHEPG
ncbi:MAG: GNAT family N-acetyltransferase [Pseudomonadota bacterium]